MGAILGVYIMLVMGAALYAQFRLSVRKVLLEWGRKISPLKLPLFRNHVFLPTPEKTYPPVEPLKDFDWSKSAPLRLRPFKPKFFMTMAINTSNVSEMIQIDRGFFRRIELRKRLLSQMPDDIIDAAPECTPAINELYTFLTNTYLPIRFGSLFRKTSSHLVNNVSSAKAPLKPYDSPLQTLRSLGTMIDEDMMFLSPSPDGDGYRLQGYMVCFASGFDLKKMFGMKLRDMHAEVPRFKEKMEKSVDRWFSRLPVGKFVVRQNWTITTNGRLRNEQGENQLYGDPVSPAEVDISDAHLRVERHFLHRLPHSGVIVFIFKTYLYPLQQIIDEGNGESLAEAIEGLGKGNCPDMPRYKRAVEWGPKVCKALRDGAV